METDLQQLIVGRLCVHATQGGVTSPHRCRYIKKLQVDSQDRGDHGLEHHGFHTCAPA